MPVQTHGTIYLKSASPGVREIRRPAVISDHRIVPRFAHQVDEREIRQYQVSIPEATAPEMYHLEELWLASREGVLPLLYPESVHGYSEDGDLPVVFWMEDLDLPWKSARFGSIDVLFREFRG